MSDKDEADTNFADDLTAAWDAAETETEQSEGDQPRDDKGRFASKDGEAEPASDKAPAETEAAAETEVEAEPAPLTAPEHWSQADKDAFNSLPEDIKPLYLDKAKSLESGYNRKFEEVATERKGFESYKGFKEIFEPYQQQLQMAGLTPEAYVRRLIATAQQLQANPRETLLYLAKQHNVDLALPQAGSEEEFTDPEVAKLKAALHDLQTQIQQSQQEQQQAAHQSLEHEWRGFIDAKDEAGNAIHPKAEELKLRIGHELQVNPQQPGESTQVALSRAYDAVKWTDPDLRQAILDAQAKATQAEQQRKADVEKAKAAGRTVRPKSTPGSDRPVPKDSWKEELEANWQQ